jgi:signal transduction histidine kinase
MGTQSNQIFVYVALTYGFVLLIFLLFIYHLRSYHKKIQQVQSEKRRAELAQLEKERMDMATELHHDLSPMLASLRILLNELENEKNQEIVQKGNQTISTAMDLVRRKIRQLSPLSFFQTNFVDALFHLAEQHQIANPELKIRISNSTLFELKEDAANHLYRVIQEIFLNTVKHSKAKHLFIDFSVDKNSLIIRTADDGIGYKDSEKSNKQSFGLLSIQNRLDQLSGFIIKNKNSSKGTQYHITIPRSWEKDLFDHFSRS